MPCGSHRFDHAFVDAAEAAPELLRRPEVTDRWARPSALPQMSTGALACPLGRQTSRAAQLLPVATGALARRERACPITAF